MGDEGLSPWADHYRRVVIYENDIDTAVREHAMGIFVRAGN
jgi:hypothetical protein